MTEVGEIALAAAMAASLAAPQVAVAVTARAVGVAEPDEE